MSIEPRNIVSNMYLRIVFYMLLTTIITLFSVLDTMDIEKIKALTLLEWFKISIKSLTPALVSLKAYFDDTSINNTTNTNNVDDGGEAS